MKKQWSYIALAVVLAAAAAAIWYFKRQADAARHPAGAGAGAGGAFCAEHQIAEARCPWCKSSLIKEMGQCGEHGVPEALCSRCTPALIPGFKAVGDWCGEHAVPESQCVKCHPDLAKPPAAAPETPAPATPGAALPAPATPSAAAVEALPRHERQPSVTCTLAQTQVKLAAPQVAADIGLEYVTVQPQAVTRELACSGQVSFNAQRLARLRPPVPAVVVELCRDIGATVATGDPLVVVDASELATAKADFLNHREALGLARRKAEHAASLVERQGRLEVRLAAVEFLRARDLLAIARGNLAREEDLLARQAGAAKPVAEARGAVLAAQAEHEAAHRRLALFGITPEQQATLTWDKVGELAGAGLASEQELLDARIAAGAAEIELAAAAHRLRALGLTDAQLELIATSRDSSGRLTLVAPFAGQVVALAAVVGEQAGTDAPLVAVADTSTVWAMLDVPEADAPQVHVGQSVQFSVEGLSGEVFGGQVTWVAPQVHRPTRTVPVRAELPNPAGQLRDGQFGRAAIRVLDGEPRLVLPTSAVQWDGCCNLAFVRHDEQTFRPRKLRLAGRVGAGYVVAAGMAPGDVVVTTGSFLLKTEILRGSIGAGCCETNPGG